MLRAVYYSCIPSARCGPNTECDDNVVRVRETVDVAMNMYETNSAQSRDRIVTMADYEIALLKTLQRSRHDAIRHVGDTVAHALATSAMRRTIVSELCEMFHVRQQVMYMMRTVSAAPYEMRDATMAVGPAVMAAAYFVSPSLFHAQCVSLFDVAPHDPYVMILHYPFLQCATWCSIVFTTLLHNITRYQNAMPCLMAACICNNRLDVLSHFEAHYPDTFTCTLGQVVVQNGFARVLDAAMQTGNDDLLRFMCDRMSAPRGAVYTYVRCPAESGIVNAVVSGMDRIHAHTHRGINHYVHMQDWRLLLTSTLLHRRFDMTSALAKCMHSLVEHELDTDSTIYGLVVSSQAGVVARVVIATCLLLALDHDCQHARTATRSLPLARTGIHTCCASIASDARKFIRKLRRVCCSHDSPYGRLLMATCKAMPDVDASHGHQDARASNGSAPSVYIGALPPHLLSLLEDSVKRAKVWLWPPTDLMCLASTAHSILHVGELINHDTLLFLYAYCVAPSREEVSSTVDALTPLALVHPWTQAAACDATSETSMHTWTRVLAYRHVDRRKYERMMEDVTSAANLFVPMIQSCHRRFYPFTMNTVSWICSVMPPCAMSKAAVARNLYTAANSIAMDLSWGGSTSCREYIGCEYLRTGSQYASPYYLSSVDDALRREHKHAALLRNVFLHVCCVPYYYLCAVINLPDDGSDPLRTCVNKYATHTSAERRALLRTAIRARMMHIAHGQMRRDDTYAGAGVDGAKNAATVEHRTAHTLRNQVVSILFGSYVLMALDPRSTLSYPVRRLFASFVGLPTQANTLWNALVGMPPRPRDLLAQFCAHV